jgi:hypothetical protein
MVLTISFPAFSQKLHGIDALEGDTTHQPRVYSQEGECEGAKTLSSHTFSEEELPADLLDGLGSKATPHEEMYFKSGIPS